MSIKDRISTFVSELFLKETPTLKVGLSIFITGMTIIVGICVVAAWFLLSPMWFFLCIGILFAMIGGYIVKRELNGHG